LLSEELCQSSGGRHIKVVGIIDVPAQIVVVHDTKTAAEANRFGYVPME